jgi:hypothetical protein
MLAGPEIKRSRPVSIGGMGWNSAALIEWLCASSYNNAIRTIEKQPDPLLPGFGHPQSTT